ncbi:hypothetical protein GGI15_001038 [Coemansia interrupta]|uniref:SET domain-containing protein n=1 Tax=Coemansia interrupta TaxID=1126814 RepID=A0A9W8HR01_9FUNG|nr:hypothetical protein GGI15_001038 [Coemansia interrupta]
MQEATPTEGGEATVMPQPHQRRSSRQPRQRYLDNSLTGNEVFDLLDDFITEDGPATRPRKRRKKKSQPKAVSAVATAASADGSDSNAAGTDSQSKQTQRASAPVRPRWYTQMYVMFLALRQSPGHTASRSDLVRRVVELDKRISEERGLPRAFNGKTPQNSASALLTNNCDRNFIQFRPEGARCFHFRLAYKPGDFEEALAAYNEWMDILINRDWPLCFGPDIDPGGEQKATEDTGLASVEVEQHKHQHGLASAEAASGNPDDCLAENLTHDQMTSGDETADRSLPAELPRPAEPLQETVDLSSIRPTSPLASPSQDVSATAVDLYDIPKSWRDIVEVKPSTIPNAGSGLFATRDLPAGIPLGFYFGVPMTEDEFDSLKENVGMSSHYSIMYRKTVLDATDENGLPYTDPDGRLYCPFHFMNEDREGEKFNIAFLEGAKVNQIICLTSRKISSGEELFVSYGNEVDRSHWDKKESQDVDSGSSKAVADAHEFTEDVDKDNARAWGIRASQMVVPASTEIDSGAQKNGIVRMLETLTTASSLHENQDYPDNGL